VTATIPRQNLKAAGRNVAPEIQFSLLATPPRQAQFGSQSQTGFDGADMAALRTTHALKQSHSQSEGTASQACRFSDHTPPRSRGPTIRRGTTNDPHRSSSCRNCTLQSSSRCAAGNQRKIRHCAWSNSQHARTAADDARWSEEPCPWPETNRTRRREESRPWRGPEEELARRHRPARSRAAAYT